MTELPITPATSDASNAVAPARTLGAGEAGGAVTESFWAQVGGTDTFEKITRKFYEGVRQDPIMAPMYPEDDWEGAIWRLRTFLEQYWGGPTTYSDNRGHPRLRMRHQPYPITPAARDRWLHHMYAALDEVALPPIYDEPFRDYIDRAAHSLVNRFE
ncbi:globin [Leucobacter sp. HY1910]